MDTCLNGLFTSTNLISKISILRGECRYQYLLADKIFKLIIFGVKVNNLGVCWDVVHRFLTKYAHFRARICTYIFEVTQVQWLFKNHHLSQNQHPEILHNKYILTLRMSTILTSCSYVGFGSSINITLNPSNFCIWNSNMTYFGVNQTK